MPHFCRLRTGSQQVTNHTWMTSPTKCSETPCRIRPLTLQDQSSFDDMLNWAGHPRALGGLCPTLQKGHSNRSNGDKPGESVSKRGLKAAPSVGGSVNCEPSLARILIVAYPCIKVADQKQGLGESTPCSHMLKPVLSKKSHPSYNLNWRLVLKPYIHHRICSGYTKDVSGSWK